VIHIIDIQYAIDDVGLPDKEQLSLWANAALHDVDTISELSIRIVDETEGAQLNEEWRKKKGPTNVLSFPAELAEEVQPSLLGDIVICAPIIAREASEQGKLLHAHWAHMVIHGTLHLLGYDHIEGAQAEIMESLEIDILNKLDIDNPYN
jgi:probable rRNA maturation factor